MGGLSAAELRRHRRAPLCGVHCKYQGTTSWRCPRWDVSESYPVVVLLGGVVESALHYDLPPFPVYESRSHTRGVLENMIAPRSRVPTVHVRHEACRCLWKAITIFASRWDQLRNKPGTRLQTERKKLGTLRTVFPCSLRTTTTTGHPFTRPTLVLDRQCRALRPNLRDPHAGVRAWGTAVV